MNRRAVSEPDPEPWAIFVKSLPGWFLVRVTGVENEFFIGAVIGDDRKPVITGFALLAEQLLTGDLRQVPLGRIQSALTNPHLLAHITAAPPAQHPLRQLQEAADQGADHVLTPTAPHQRLTRPDGRDPTAFYGQVASAYRHYTTVSPRPAVEISVEAGVPVATARRWINHARELGLLEKGQRGRAI